MCGPMRAVEGKSSKYVVIAPGKTDRSKISSALSKSFQVPEEEISRILPPGNIEIKESKGVEVG